MWNKLEKKFGRYAVPNLIVYLIGGYIIGYIFQMGSVMTKTDLTAMMRLEPYYIIHGLQLWRLVTWVLIPPNQNLLFVLIMIIFYYQLGKVLERTWGTFRFNVYIFGGIFCTIVGAFLLYGVYMLLGLGHVVGIGYYFSTTYINMSIFLAFAVCYPEMEVRLYFLIPIKMKWMAVVYAALIFIEILEVDWNGRVAVFCSLANFVIFFLSTRNYNRINPKELHRRHSYVRATRPKDTDRRGNPIAKHKCAICGRTELTHSDLEFRFCSKCNGNYEYCQDHLFTHKHVQ